jgi:hypothetical protein
VSVSAGQATEVAAFVAAGASVLGIIAQYHFTRRNEVSKWQREHLLPSVARLLTLSETNRRLHTQANVYGNRHHVMALMDANVADMRGLSEEIALLAPDLAQSVSDLFKRNSPRQAKSHVPIFRAEQEVTRIATAELRPKVVLAKWRSRSKVAAAQISPPEQPSPEIEDVPSRRRVVEKPANVDREEDAE